MSNITLSLFNTTHTNWCIPLTGSVYLYGHLIPGIALFIFGLTFHPIALYYFATSRNFRRSAYSYYFSSIAVVDLVRLTVWFLFFLLDFKIFKLHFHSFECATQSFTESVAGSISAWLTVLLTVERCLVIYKPLQTLTDTRGKRALVVILCVTLASFVINSLLLQPGFYVKRLECKINFIRERDTKDSSISFLFGQTQKYILKGKEFILIISEDLYYIKPTYSIFLL
jgi:hypothetical protein